MFCEKCGSLMLPREGKLLCKNCGFEKEIKNKNSFKLVQEGSKKRDIIVLEKEIRTKPTVRAECPKCGNMDAEWWLRQTRRADEPETKFFRCTKCRHVWRDYH